MDIAAMLTKCAFNLGDMFGKEDQGWTPAGPTTMGPELKTKQNTPGVTYVQQTPGKSPVEQAQQQQNPLMQLFMMKHLMGSDHAPTVTVGGGQQDPLHALLMMHFMGQGSKTSSVKGDISSIAGRHSGDYAKNILRQLTPEHFQAAGGSGGEDTIEELVRNIVPREIVSRHAMQLGGGNVELGKAILDTHLRQNPMHTGENLESSLRRMLKANIVETQDAHLRKSMGNIGDFGQKSGPSRIHRDELMKIIQEAGSAGQAPQQAQSQAPALPERGMGQAMGYPKTGRFENMQDLLPKVAADLVKSALPAPLGKAVEFFRGGPAVSPQEIATKLPTNRFVQPSGKPFEFDPESFQNVFMQDPSVRRLGRGLTPEITAQMGRALAPGHVFGPLSRMLQKHVMGRGSHLEAAQQALRNMATSTGFSGKLSPEALSQHFQTVTGMPGKNVGDFLSRQLAAAGRPQSGGQASNLFGIPGLGMEVGDPMHQMIQQLAAIRSMTSPQQQQQPHMGAA